MTTKLQLSDVNNFQWTNFHQISQNAFSCLVKKQTHPVLHTVKVFQI